jgi:hypothetical protein
MKLLDEGGNIPAKNVFVAIIELSMSGDLAYTLEKLKIGERNSL